MCRYDRGIPCKKTTQPENKKMLSELILSDLKPLFDRVRNPVGSKDGLRVYLSVCLNGQCVYFCNICQVLHFFDKPGRQLSHCDNRSPFFLADIFLLAYPESDFLNFCKNQEAKV